MTKYHVGIDLHKTVVQVCVRDGRGEVLEERRHPLPDAEAGAALMRYLARWACEGRLAVEALGCNRWRVNACRAAGHEVLIVHAAALGLKMQKRKPDRRDAQEIARRLYLGDLDRHARSYYPSDEEFGRRKLLRIRHRQVQRRQQTGNQIRSILNAYLLRPPQAVLTGRRSMVWLRQLELATPELTFTLQVLVDDLENLLAQIGRLDERIAELRTDVDVALLERERPQIAVQSAAVLRYELGDVRRFRRAREVAAYAGVVPSVSQSGEGSANHGPITKRGNRELRGTLTQWAVRLLATHPVVKSWSKRQRGSLTKNKRRLALARRLLLGVWVMLARGEVFSLERCLGVDPAWTRRTSGAEPASAAEESLRHRTEAYFDWLLAPEAAYRRKAPPTTPHEAVARGRARRSDWTDPKHTPDSGPRAPGMRRGQPAFEGRHGDHDHLRPDQPPAGLGACLPLEASQERGGRTP